MYITVHMNLVLVEGKGDAADLVKRALIGIGNRHTLYANTGDIRPQPIGKIEWDPKSILISVDPEPIIPGPKERFLSALAAMPAEAFTWVILAAQPSAMTQGGNAQIWPDGIGGFSADSKTAIEKARAAAAAFLKG